MIERDAISQTVFHGNSFTLKVLRSRHVQTLDMARRGKERAFATSGRGVDNGAREDDGWIGVCPSAVSQSTWRVIFPSTMIFIILCALTVLEHLDGDGRLCHVLVRGAMGQG